MEKFISLERGDKIHILSNGNQPPYGLDETMDVIPAAHIRKVIERIRYWYTKPSLRIDGRNRWMVPVEIVYDEDKRPYYAKKED